MAVDYGAKRRRAEGGVPKCIVCVRLILEKVGHAWMRRESEHILRCVVEERKSDQLSELTVEGQEYVHKRKESLGIIWRKGLCFYVRLVDLRYAGQRKPKGRELTRC